MNAEGTAVDRFVILNGTLCGPELWNGFERRLHSASVAFEYPEITDGRSVLEIARSIGASLPAAERNWLLGYSLGGIVALEVARLSASRLAGLILVCTNADGQTEEKDRALQERLDYLAARGLEPVFDDLLLPAYFGASLPRFQEQAEAIKRSGIGLGEEVYRNQLKTLKTRRDQHAYLPALPIPTLIVYGEHDTLCTPAQNRAMGALIPNSVIHQCDGVGHALPLLRHEELAARVADFVSFDTSSEP